MSRNICSFDLQADHHNEIHLVKQNRTSAHHPDYIVDSKFMDVLFILLFTSCGDQNKFMDVLFIFFIYISLWLEIQKL